jgi:hypothetical protein
VEDLATQEVLTWLGRIVGANDLRAEHFHRLARESARDPE